MIEVAAYTDVGGRDNNEDALRWTERDQRLCAVVADGLGGHGGGEIASALAVEGICGGWDGKVLASALADRVRAAHQAIRERQTTKNELRTTVVALAVATGYAAWAHVGDSRLYHFFNGKLVFQTRDHSASQIAVVLGEITPDQIRFHEDRNKVFRTLGQEGTLSVDAKELELAEGDHVWLLCTDGFWEYVLEEEMEADLRASHTPRQWLDRMRRRLEEKIPTNNDNNTALAVWMRE